jgi:hypothetical protein
MVTLLNEYAKLVAPVPSVMLSPTNTHRVPELLVVPKAMVFSAAVARVVSAAMLVVWLLIVVSADSSPASIAFIIVVAAVTPDENGSVDVTR